MGKRTVESKSIRTDLANNANHGTSIAAGKFQGKFPVSFDINESRHEFKKIVRFRVKCPKPLPLGEDSLPVRAVPSWIGIRRGEKADVICVRKWEYGIGARWVPEAEKGK
jgi:hypothetical protein